MTLQNKMSTSHKNAIFKLIFRLEKIYSQIKMKSYTTTFHRFLISEIDFKKLHFLPFLQP